MKKIIILMILSALPIVSLAKQRRSRPMQNFDTHIQQFYRGKKVVVTGGCGFIGSHIAQALVSLGAEVTILDNLIM